MKSTIICVSAVLACSAIADSQDARDALQLINHVNCAVAEITQSKDKLILEREYNALTVDSLKLDSIGDYETIDTIKNLMEAAKKLRISSVDREMLQEEIDQEMNDALYSAMPNIGSLASPNLLSTAVNLTVGAASAYVNYEKQKKAIRRRAKKANWEIDKNDIETLDGLNQDLLDSQWRIVQRYKINDYDRVTSRLISQMIEHFKDPDKKRRYEFFALHEKEYRTFTRYWYYRAVAAFEIGLKGDAYKSIENFQRNFLQIVRNDKIAALVAMMKVQMLLERRWVDSEIRKQLVIIENNATLDDWNLLYFCGLVYADKLNDKEQARRVLKKAVNELSFKQENRLSSFRGNLKADEKLGVEDVPSADALMICRTKLQLIDKDHHEGEIRSILLQSIEKENSFILDSLYYVGRTKDTEMLKRLFPYIMNTTLASKTHWGREDSFYVYLPVAWFQVSDLKPTLLFGTDGVPISDTGRELCKEAVSPFAGLDAETLLLMSVMPVVGGAVSLDSAREARKFSQTKKNLPRLDDAYVRLRYRAEIDNLEESVSEAILTIPHKYCTVKMIFPLPKDEKGRHVAGIAMPSRIQIADKSVFEISVKDMSAMPKDESGK